MVLAELSTQITQAFRKLHATTVISEAVIEEVIGDILRALLAADVNVKLVYKLRENVKRLNSSNAEMIGANKRRYIQKIVVDELIAMLTTEKKPFMPKKGRSNVIMFVGLQGAGKTTSCTKYAYYYQRKGWRTALICADTFRAGAFDQLKQNAAKVKISFFGSYSEGNPAKVASDGVARFKAEKYDMIIVDTSGRHKQEDALFDEMKLIYDAVQPDEVVFVMDSHIGQACYDQAAAFNKAIDVGSVIITKLDGHARGGGALSAVAATNSPIIFIGTGEHFDDFEQFDAKSFVSRLLGLGDLSGLINTIKDVINLDEQSDLIERLSAAKFTIRDMYDQFQNLLKMAPIGKVMSMLPGIPPELLAAGREQEGVARIKRFMVIMDSMTDEGTEVLRRVHPEITREVIVINIISFHDLMERGVNITLYNKVKITFLHHIFPELDCEKPLNETRILRIARGSGSSPAEISGLIDQHKMLQKMVGSMGKMGLNKESAIQNMMRNPNQLMNKMQSMMDPKLLQHMGGPGTLMKMMKEFSQNKDLQSLMKQTGFKR